VGPPLARLDKEVTDIIKQYYDSEIDLDGAIERMENYWKISLVE
jgi:hypothetical protein